MTRSAVLPLCFLASAATAQPLGVRIASMDARTLPRIQLEEKEVARSDV